MSIVLPALAVAVAALCVWLTVRIANRRERWARRMAVGLVVLLLAYPLSFGPACWINARTDVGYGLMWVVYRPLFEIMLREGVRPIQSALWAFADLGVPEGHHLAVWKDGFYWYTGRVFD